MKSSASEPGLTSHLGQSVGLVEGQVDSLLETCNDPKLGSFTDVRRSFHPC